MKTWYIITRVRWISALLGLALLVIPSRTYATGIGLPPDSKVVIANVLPATTRAVQIEWSATQAETDPQGPYISVHRADFKKSFIYRAGSCLRSCTVIKGGFVTMFTTREVVLEKVNPDCFSKCRLRRFYRNWTVVVSYVAPWDQHPKLIDTF